MIDWIDVAFLSIGFFGGFMIREALRPVCWYQKYKVSKTIRNLTDDELIANIVIDALNKNG